MTISQAIRKARKEVVFVPTAERLNGYRQARIHTWSDSYRAWVEGRNTDYQVARMQAADEITYRAVRYLLPDLDEHVIHRLTDRDAAPGATPIERVRAACAAAGTRRTPVTGTPRTPRLDHTVLDRMTPDEADLPPSARTWTRLVRLPGGWEALELRDPTEGHGGPEHKSRHQYIVARERLWRRRLPPATLDAPHDEARWRDEPQGVAEPRTHSAWQLVEPGTGLPWEWSGLRAPYIISPRRVRGEWDIHGGGRPATVAYEMPARNPWDIWADVTDAPCPAPDCGQRLVWYEAGYVPGYRACMRVLGDGYDRSSLRHRWLWWQGVLVGVVQGER